MVRKLKETFSITLKLNADLKNIIEKRAQARSGSVNDEIIAAINSSLSESEKMQLNAQLYVNSYLKARVRQRARAK